MLPELGRNGDLKGARTPIPRLFLGVVISQAAAKWRTFMNSFLHINQLVHKFEIRERTGRRNIIFYTNLDKSLAVSLCTEVRVQLCIVSIIFVLHSIDRALWTVPLSTRLAGQSNTLKVEPLDRTVAVITSNHFSVGDLLTNTIGWFVRIDWHVQHFPWVIG